MQQRTRQWGRWGIGCGIGAVALSLVFGVRLLAVYRLPAEPLRVVALPQPNGYLMAVAACQLQVKEINGVRSSNPKGKIAPLAARRALWDANHASITALRESLDEEWLLPTENMPSRSHPEWAQLREEARLLAQLGVGIAIEEKNYPEAARRATDAIALGVFFPRGGGLLSLMAGQLCEERGTEALWGLVDQLDAATARATLQRLQKIATHRATFAQMLAVEKPIAHRTMRAFYGSNPLQTAQHIDASFGVTGNLIQMMDSVTGQERPEPSLWQKLSESAAQTRFKLLVIAAGPRSYEQQLDPWLDAVAAASDKPWDAPEHRLSPPADTTGLLLPELYTQAEVRYRRAAAELALLQTYLALRVYRSETGRYPAQLDALVKVQIVPTLPVDPFSQKSLRYDGKSLWSTGKDIKDARERHVGLEKLLPQ